MSVTVIATVGDPTANSYLTLAEAQTYRDTQTVASPGWDSATTDQKNRALVTATRLLDENVEWKGYASSATQALQWPRTFMTRDRALLLWPPGAQPFDYWNSFYEDPTQIPQRLKNATAELARQLLEADRQSDDDLSRMQITGIDAGGVKINFKGYTRSEVIPDTVFYMVRCWGRIRHRSEPGRLRRC